MIRSSTREVYTLALYDPLDHRQKPKEIDLDLIPDTLAEMLAMVKEYNEAVLEHDDLFHLLGVFQRTQVKRNRTKSK